MPSRFTSIRWPAVADRGVRTVIENVPVTERSVDEAVGCVRRQQEGEGPNVQTQEANGSRAMARAVPRLAIRCGDV